MNYPKISIITPSYNQGQFLEKTILSVINQNYPNIEFIIIDGGSTDGSVEIIKRYNKYINYWVSEKDNGQSYAINKGVDLSSGEFVTWLNSDDILMPGALNEFVVVYKKNEHLDWFTGNSILITDDDKIIKCRKGEKWNSILSGFGILNVYGPSSFMRRGMFIKVGRLNEDLHYMMDTELWWRLIKSGYRFKRLKKYVWGLRLHKDAKMSGHLFRSSPTFNKNHPTWKEKTREHQFIQKKYIGKKSELNNLIGITYLQLLRLFSVNYLISFFHSFIFKNKYYLILREK